MHLFFSVGEPSGDDHAAGLIGELSARCPSFKASGFGGPRMRQAGCQVDFELTDLAVMGFVRVVPLLAQFRRLVKQAYTLLEEQRPDAVVLVDFPGFNWWVARQAKKLGIPVIYYSPPQLWAWASYRVRRMRRLVDHVFCFLPFEKDWFQQHGLKSVHYVGHPFVYEALTRRLDPTVLVAEQRKSGPVVAILPGSRNAEVRNNWPLHREIMTRLTREFPSIRFLVACYKKEHQTYCENNLPSDDGKRLPAQCLVGKTGEVLEVADACVMVSGSVSLEVLARAVPAAVIYRVGCLWSFLSKIVPNVRYISLPNIVVDDEVIPEFLTADRLDLAVTKILKPIQTWLRDNSSRLQQSMKEARLRDQLILSDPAAKSAEILLHELPIGKTASHSNAVGSTDPTSQAA